MDDKQRDRILCSLYVKTIKMEKSLSGLRDELHEHKSAHQAYNLIFLKAALTLMGGIGAGLLMGHYVL